MSTYELDDDVVRAWLYGNPDGNLAGALRAQLPPEEPGREYLLKDKDGDIWAWSARQSAWECVTGHSTPLSWATLRTTLGPLKIYGEI